MSQLITTALSHPEPSAGSGVGDDMGFESDGYDESFDIHHGRGHPPNFRGGGVRDLLLSRVDEWKELGSPTPPGWYEDVYKELCGRYGRETVLKRSRHPNVTYPNESEAEETKKCIQVRFRCVLRVVKGS